MNHLIYVKHGNNFIIFIFSVLQPEREVANQVNNETVDQQQAEREVANQVNNDQQQPEGKIYILTISVLILKRLDSCNLIYSTVPPQRDIMDLDQPNGMRK